MNVDALLHWLVELATSLGLKLLGAAILLVVGLKVIKWIKKWLRTSHKLDKVDAGARTFLVSFAGIALYALLFITIAMTLGIPATSFITVLASCGVAIGLALQGALSNFAGGLMILLFKPFKVGDYIETPGAAGTVSNITVVYTVLYTLDNKIITIPNGTLTNSVVQNYSAAGTRRLDLTFNTAYECDVEQVKAVLTDVLVQHPLVLRNPAPLARLSAHGDSALTYTVRVWCKAGDYWDLPFDLTEAVKEAFDKNGIAIPFPQMDVHVKPQ